jgi:hypothetical protein
MKITFLRLVVVGLVGCGDLTDAIEAERKPVSPPGIAPVDQMDGMNVGRQANGNAAAGNNANAGANKSSIIGKTDGKVVDMKKAMAENPDLVIVQNKIEGNDPFSAYGSAYVSMTSNISINAFKHNLNLWKNMPENDRRNPTYKKFMEMAKELQFNRLPPYQMYGYDSDTGNIMVLEDKADKKRRYEAAGIPLDE